MNIYNLADFKQWVTYLVMAHGFYNFLYRGVPDETYDIGEASAYRRLPNKEDRIPAKLIEINQGLINHVRDRKFDHKYGRDLSDLEILGELQHFRAATCLIDFTFNPLVALWFACKPCNDGIHKDGKVAAVLNDHSIKKVRSEWLQQSNKEEVKDIGFFFEADKNVGKYSLYQWQPWGLNNRILAQDAVFLFGAAPIEAEECIISGASKLSIRRELKQYANISEDTLFPDYEGFIEQNTHDVSYVIPDYGEIGLQAHQKSEYKTAIDNYTKAINLDPNNTKKNNDKIYLQLGSAKYSLGLNEEAITDFNKALELNPKNVDALGHRGIVKSQLGHHEEAITDFDEAIKLKPNDPGLLNTRGVIRYIFKQYEAAINDFDKALKINARHAGSLHYRGLVKVQLGQNEEAIEDMNEAITINPNDASMYNSLGDVYERIGDYDKARHNYLMARDLAHVNDTDFRSKVRESLDRIEKLIGSF